MPTSSRYRLPFKIIRNKCNWNFWLWKRFDSSWFLTSIIRHPIRFDWNAVTRAVSCANSPSNSVNAAPLSAPADVYLACKRNDTAFAGVIDTSLFNRSSIDPLVNYRESPGTNHHCGDTVTGHRSILVCPCSFLPAVSLNFVPSLSFRICSRLPFIPRFPLSLFFLNWNVASLSIISLTVYLYSEQLSSNDDLFVNLLVNSFTCKFLCKWNFSFPSVNFTALTVFAIATILLINRLPFNFTWSTLFTVQIAICTAHLT